MGRCGCEGTTCGCKVTGTGNARVTGSGTGANPYNVDVVLSMLALSTGSVGLQLLGSGTEGDPWILSANFAGMLDDLLDVDTSGGATGYVLARLADGSYALAPPATATPGAIATDNSLEGDGSGGDVLALRLAPNSGLAVGASGTFVDPFIATSPATLDAEWGSVLPGTFVALASGAAVWMKTASGWVDIIEDTGIIGTVAGNWTTESGWEITSMQMARRNGIVQTRLSFKTLIARSTAIDNGNIGNIKVATIIPAEFRPRFDTPFRALSAGSDWGWYMTGSGAFYANNVSQPDVVFPAGYAFTAGGTYQGA